MTPRADTAEARAAQFEAARRQSIARYAPNVAVTAAARVSGRRMGIRFRTG